MAKNGTKKYGRNKRDGKADLQRRRTEANKARAIAFARVNNPKGLSAGPSPNYNNPKRTKAGTWLWEYVRDLFTGRKTIVRCARASIS